MAVAVMLVGVAAPGGAYAQAPQVAVVGKGLNNPRGITVGLDGAVYVAEAGKGGNGPCIGSGENRACYGPTGAITRIYRGAQVRVVRNLPSFAGQGGFAASGPHDVGFAPAGMTQQGGAAARPDLYAVIGEGPRAALGRAGRGFTRLVRFVPSTGGVANVKDLQAFERRNNPDGQDTLSNPYSVLALPDRTTVADAGGNDLVQVRRNGATSALAVFPDRFVRDPQGNRISMDSVPDALAAAPDGSIYVGELTGYPFPVRGAWVYRVTPDGRKSIYARNFTAIIDVAVGRDGSLYVLELVRKGLLQAEGPEGDFEGRLVRVYPNKRRVVVAQAGLVAPGGVAVAPDNTLYVTNFSIFPGQGQVLRIRQ